MRIFIVSVPKQIAPIKAGFLPDFPEKTASKTLCATLQLFNNPVTFRKNPADFLYNSHFHPSSLPIL